MDPYGEISRLATWARKQAKRLQAILAREA